MVVVQDGILTIITFVMQLREQRQTSFMRQVSLPDINELADIWGELSSDVTFDLDNLQKDAPPGLQPNLLQSNLSLRQSSLAKWA